MATKKSAKQIFTVTGTIKNLQVGKEVVAESIEAAIEEGRKLKFSDFVTTNGEAYDWGGPEITGIWKG